ncbi:HlyD family secretion protein [Pendulispora albinea]|uniref:HlyD family secretion protein n=1 Tax=Pendulispora albinea TaxID=2741071 RepID=UPI00374E075E
MADMFRRTLRSIERDSLQGCHVMALVAAVLLAAWSVWLFVAKVSIYETSETARLEVLHATHPVDAPIAGRAVKVDLVLDREVQEGDIIMVLDAEPQRLELSEVRARVASVAPKLAATRAELDAEKQALAHFRNQGKAAIDESASRSEEARIAATLARDEFDRIERLQKSGAIAEIDAVRGKAEAQSKAAAEAALRSQQSKLERGWMTGQSDRSARIASLQLDVVRLESELVPLHAKIESLEHEIERRRIRAPASGRIGEIGAVRPGSFVDEGEHVGTIVARGDLRVVAEFKPASAFGRIRTGQLARVRFDGFPWTQFGETRAQVADVASEVRGGRARVEFVILKAHEGIPMQHGLPGCAEVEVESATPAELALRAAGDILRRSRPPQEPAGDRRERITRR